MDLTVLCEAINIVEYNKQIISKIKFCHAEFI